MKKYKYLLIIIFNIIIAFCGCSSNNHNYQANSIDDCVAYEISKIDNSSELSNEQIKALSVVIRTNYNVNPSLIKKDFNKENIDSKTLNLVKSTSGEVLIDGEKFANVSYNQNYSDEIWHENIKKSSILKYMKENNINLSNISNINSEMSEDGKLQAISVGGKQISYDELKNIFNIKSDIITDIKNNSQSIDIYGKTPLDKDCFYLKKLNKNEDDYRQILKQYYNNYDLKTI